MPEIGFDDEPISPVRRDETVTNRNPKSTISTAAARLTQFNDCRERELPPASRVQPQKGPNGQHQEQRSKQNDSHRKVAVGAARAVRNAAGRSARMSLRPAQIDAMIIGNVPQHADDAAGGHGARADVEHVDLADFVGVHVADQLRARARAARRAPLPKNTIAGNSTSQAKTPPATMMQEIRVPMM